MTTWEILDKVLDAKTPRILLSGPPAVGKSFTPWSWATSHDHDFLSVTLTEETPMAELRGHFILKGNEFVWHDGLVARAWRLSHTHPKGVVLVLNEIDHASGDVLSFLHNALDDAALAQLHLPTGETLRPNPDHLITVATMNEPPSVLPLPIRDRFPVTLEVTRPHPKALATVPAGYHALIVNSIKTDRAVTLRQVQAYEALRASCGEPLAAQAVFSHAASDFLAAIKLAGTHR